MKKLQLFIQLSIAVLISYPVYGQEVISLDRASQTSSGAGVNNDVGLPSLSSNSDRIVFATKASNLVSSDTNNKVDIYLKELSTGTITRISDTGVTNPTTGLVVESNNDSRSPDISPATANGFFGIAFESDADNIGRKRSKFPDNNRRTDIYLSVPRRANFLERISVGPAGLEADNDSEQPSIAAVPALKIFRVAYASNAKNLTATPDQANREDIFLANVTLPKADVFDPSQHIVTEKVSNGLNGQEANGRSLNPTISLDGRYIVYESFADNLTVGSAPTAKQIYLYDIDQKVTILISKDASGNPGNDTSQDASISFNGKFVVYTSRASNIINDGYVPSGDYLQVFLFNTLTGQTTRVNTSSSGVPGDGNDGSLAKAVVSADGRFVMFSDTAGNLISGDTNGKSDIYIKDTISSNIVRVSKKPGGPEADGGSFGPTFARTTYNSDVGRCTYASNADNLVSNDTEGKSDVFFSTVSIPPLPLTKDTKIEVPADFVLNSNNKRAIVTLQSFSGVSATALRSVNVLAAGTPKIRYSIKLNQLNVPRKRADIRTIISKRNTLAIKSLKPGNYSMKYQAQVVKNDKVIQKTPFSPTVFFNTLDE
jgi:hypothetical protein